VSRGTHHRDEANHQQDPRDRGEENGGPPTGGGNGRDQSAGHRDSCAEPERNLAESAYGDAAQHLSDS
jgi:hypothetical protein